MREVVVYDEGDSTIAARAWWLLRHAGHPRVRVLDGGVAAWRAAGHAVETGDDKPGEPGDFTSLDYVSGSGLMPVLDAVGAAALAREGTLLDARATPRYRGETEPIDPVAGHVPGALSAPTAGNSAPDGTFLVPERLRARFAALGVTGDLPIGAYCGSGVTAAHQVLALELAGLSAALYAGSWSEWIADPERPIALGG
jgi:thiosulfate/3-mercaptopyruvate sulfurtransferase